MTGVRLLLHILVALAAIVFGLAAVLMDRLDQFVGGLLPGLTGAGAALWTMVFMAVFATVAIWQPLPVALLFGFTGLVWLINSDTRIVGVFLLKLATVLLVCWKLKTREDLKAYRARRDPYVPRSRKR